MGSIRFSAREIGFKRSHRSENLSGVRWPNRPKDATILAMVPPEVILDRFVRTQLCNEAGFSGYLGKLDLKTVESPSFRSFLYLFQDTMNEALRLEGVNASGSVEQPPFHFDYLDVSGGITNAHAFQHGGFAFIAVTLPMVELVWHLSLRLSRSPLVCRLLNSLPTALEPDALQSLLFEIQLNFLVSHEYTHHVHRHCEESQAGLHGLWTEFLRDETGGTTHLQAQELDADAYATYLLLAHLLRGERRESALALLGRADALGLDGDELLLTCFFLSVVAFFCAFWRGGVDMASIYQVRHPPPPIRIKYAIQVAEMWSGQNQSARRSWFVPARFQALFGAAADVIGGTARQEWDAQMLFLRGADGSRYDGQLFERFEAIRQKRDLAHAAPGVEVTS